MSANKNKVVTLHPDYPEFSYYEEGFNEGYQMRVKEGEMCIRDSKMPLSSNLCITTM